MFAQLKNAWEYNVLEPLNLKMPLNSCIYKLLLAAIYIYLEMSEQYVEIAKVSLVSSFYKDFGEN